MVACLIDEEAVYLHESAVRGHHIYKRVWSLTTGEELELTRKEGNEHDCSAVCLVKGDVVIGHVPKELSHNFGTS